jgi:general secretion pathway protein D
MRRRVRCIPRWAACALLLALPAVAPLSAQQVRAVPGGAMLNFQDADFGFVVSALAQAAGINFAYTDLPQRPVTLRTPQPVTAEQMLELIRGLAQAYGVTIIESAGMMRLQGMAQAQAGEDPRQLHILKLKHSRAPVLANTLQQLFGAAMTARPGQQTTQTLGQQLRVAQQQAQPGQPPQIQVFPAGATAVAGQWPVVIVPDEVTNSLLIRATPQDLQVMQQAIQALDLRPLQVVIEVVIAEVRHFRELNFGTSVTAADTRAREGESTVGTLPGRASDIDFSLRLVRRGNIDVEATLSALATSGQVRILSRPVVQAQNNQEARISVGEQRPFVSTARSLPTVEPVLDRIVTYREVGTTLTILPTINDDGYVNLAITQEVSNATNEIQFDAPVISTREAQTQILALNGQTVVIGGLIDRATDRTRGGVPILKDIPLLGLLFGTTRENVGHSELFLFLTPHIVATDEEADRLKREIEENAELIRPLAPIQPLIPPARPVPPDTIPPGALLPDLLPTAVPQVR